MKAVVRLNWIQKLTVPDLFTGDDTNDADTIWLGKKRIKIADYPLIRRILTEDLEEGKNYIPPPAPTTPIFAASTSSALPAWP